MTKLEWMRTNWDEGDYTAAKKSIVDALLRYRSRLRQANLLPPEETPAPARPAPRRLVKMSTEPTLHPASKRLRSGLARLASYSRSLSQIDPAPTSSQEEATEPTPEAAEESAEELERRLAENDRKAVDEELAKWEADGLLEDDDPKVENFDLVEFWQVRPSSPACTPAHSNLHDTSGEPDTVSSSLAPRSRHPPDASIGGTLRASILLEQRNGCPAAFVTVAAHDGDAADP